MSLLPRNNLVRAALLPGCLLPCSLFLVQAQALAHAQSMAPQASAPVASTLHSLLDQPAQPAAIDLSGGVLTIRATNSSLRSILDALEQRTGTHVEGLAKDERIFGIYGPGNPQQVLSALLDDSGYNVLISGIKDDGAPREIVLTTRTSTAPAAATTPTQAAQEDDDSDDSTPPPQPAAFAPPPPQPAAGAQANPQQIKTPQQMLEELQRLRQQQGGTTTAAPQ